MMLVSPNEVRMIRECRPSLLTCSSYHAMIFCWPTLLLYIELCAVPIAKYAYFRLHHIMRVENNRHRAIVVDDDLHRCAKDTLFDTLDAFNTKLCGEIFD